LEYNDAATDIDEIINGLKDEQCQRLFHCSKDEYLDDRDKDWLVKGKELPGVLATRDSMNSMKWLLININDNPKSVLHRKKVNNLITLYRDAYRFILEMFHEKYAEDFSREIIEEKDLGLICINIFAL
jgi:hypothetical protein